MRETLLNILSETDSTIKIVLQDSTLQDVL